MEDSVTLRDKFALYALHALIVEPEWNGEQSALKALLAGADDPLKVLTVADRYAIASYLLADAMLRARQVGQGPNK